MNNFPEAVRADIINPGRVVLVAAFFFAFSFGIISLFAEYAPDFTVQAPLSDGFSSSAAAAEGAAGRTVINSRYFTVYCERTVDVRTVARRLGSGGVSFFGSGSGATPEIKVADRLDGLLKRVEEILDMRPRAARFNVRIFNSRDNLEQEYRRIFGKTQNNLKAFYVHKYKTIYAYESGITDSIIAHEIAHAVIDSYFSVIPPTKVAEIMASYVDLHLEESY
ncbi:MAG: hypothetical protein NC938_04920 [Candidatus Omnitrophica bacterium]|nr:hypothetical protein [Candidatus Omnitrophota bacterium]MCM8791025.1 hypothetical protein [Candidatus Omnitrophota bacterium]